MPFAAAAVCPHPPLLVPQFAGQAAAELDELRAACHEALALLFGAAPELIVVVGTGGRTAGYPAGTRSTLAPWGVDVPVTLGAAGGGPSGDGLPLSLVIGAWLLGVPSCPVVGQAVRADLPPEDCVRLGRILVDRPERTALLVMGDGSACRSEKAPGYLDERAEPFDKRIAAALHRGDPGALADIDAEEAAELRCSGRVPWQVLAGAAATGTRPHRPRLLYDGAPYGVGYLVASWS